MQLNVLAISCQKKKPSDGDSTPRNDNAPITSLERFSAFSAKMDISIAEGKSKKDPMEMIMNISFLDGKVRTDMDMSEIKSAQIPPQVAAQQAPALTNSESLQDLTR